MNTEEDRIRTLGISLQRQPYMRERGMTQSFAVAYAAGIIGEPQEHLDALVAAGVLEKHEEFVQVQVPIRTVGDVAHWQRYADFALLTSYRLPRQPEIPHEHTPEVSFIDGQEIVVRCEDENCHQVIGRVPRRLPPSFEIPAEVVDDDEPF